jgi:tRNA pseudouridine55 synthase
VNGLLLVNKPIGWTSFDVVNKVRRIVAEVEGKKPKHVKVGHTGTLDPQATGLLILCIGSYTKKVPELIKQDKIYEVTMCLGKTSTTGDVEGELTAVSDHVPSEEELHAALERFVGEIMQIPPVFSAIKVNGKRAYDLARAGKEVQLTPRPVTIYEIEDVDYSYPVIRFTTRVGSGTYIRSLVSDLGETLNVGAYMTALSRTAIGSFKLADAVTMSEITIDTITSLLIEAAK